MSIDAHIESHLNCTVDSKTSLNCVKTSAFKVKMTDGKTLFAKYQETANNNLINQSIELTLLGESLTTPKVLDSCQHCLLLEWVETGNCENHQHKIGLAMANLHKQSNDVFGFEFDNTIGEMPQHNGTGENITSWRDFYWKHRLLFQIESSKQKQLINDPDYKRLLSIETVLDKLLSDSITPSLLHGDLWSGNVIITIQGPVLIDSAAYYGHREADFALMFMFGGFGPEVFEAYNEVYPFDKGFDERKPLYMLYHYLNHLNIFGSGYHAGVMNCAKLILHA
jgi:fructosamine-3-kinase